MSISGTSSTFHPHINPHHKALTSPSTGPGTSQRRRGAHDLLPEHIACNLRGRPLGGRSGMVEDSGAVFRGCNDKAICSHARAPTPVRPRPGLCQLLGTKPPFAAAAPMTTLESHRSSGIDTMSSQAPRSIREPLISAAIRTDEAKLVTLDNWERKMRLLGGIKDTYKKSEAAVVVQNLLEMQKKSGLFDSGPASSATSLVDAVWTKNPHLFDGRFGQRPHKISLAASAFSNAIDVLEVGNPNSNSFAMCLGNILNELSVNGKLYPLNNLDIDLLDTASKTFTRISEEFAASPLGQEIDNLMNQNEDG